MLLMTYLSPEIEALEKHKDSRSLVRPTVSCGIFQDYEDNAPKLNDRVNTEKG